MRADLLKKKNPEVKAILEKSNLMKKTERSKRKKRQTARTSGAEDDTTAASDGELGVQRLSAEDAIGGCANGALLSRSAGL
ncbi:hypothetical protein LZ31DRAFT_243354 [Colletotrichum somersetense]|nr:hypothetical protein LZ31DRAFT_243354 [Colletotrichum somersetense]